MPKLPLKSAGLAILAGGLILHTPLLALTPTAATESTPPTVATEATTVEAPQAIAQLNDDSLKQMLTDMGYAPTKLSKGFLIALKRENNWTVNMQLVISPNQTKLGFNANLGRIEDATTVTADQWMALLVANGDIDPSSFYYDKDLKKLYLHRSLDNRAVTSEFLRNQIENFVNNVVGTEKLWNFTK